MINIQDLYTQRVLVFLETEPQSNIYAQVILNIDQYKKITTNIGRAVKAANKNNIEHYHVELSDEHYPLPDLPDVLI